MSKIKLPCTNCGILFEREKGEYNRSNKGKNRQFCSQSCATSYANKCLRDPKTLGNVNNLIPDNRKDEFSPFRWFLKCCRSKARKNPRKCVGITLEHLRSVWEKQNGICPYSGWKLILPDTTNGWETGESIYNASLDRINSSLGYIEGNVQFVARVINNAKGTLPEKEFCEMLDAIAEYRFSLKYQQ